MPLEPIHKKLSDEVNKYILLQKDFQKIVNIRQQLDEQLNENKIVKEEFDLLEDDACVYKLVGPALIKQDLKDSKDNVNSRIKYITNEIKKHDESIKTLYKSLTNQREVINKIQTQLRTTRSS